MDFCWHSNTLKADRRKINRPNNADGNPICHVVWLMFSDWGIPLIEKKWILDSNNARHLLLVDNLQHQWLCKFSIHPQERSYALLCLVQIWDINEKWITPVEVNLHRFVIDSFRELMFKLPSSLFRKSYYLLTCLI